MSEPVSADDGSANPAEEDVLMMNVPDETVEGLTQHKPGLVLELRRARHDHERMAARRELDAEAAAAEAEEEERVR